ncbi:hypothetical protein F2P81_020047 [Scophthalmus maximus]|uniref:VWFA domain-containing protein n=1 Tax=Scophthalmus maximus TaxID=52904 RepID=A0A6A4RWW7_SCOMX|nr:hypothetical protein F2P81_020047 [Scophthalmus maximus]
MWLLVSEKDAMRHSSPYAFSDVYVCSLIESDSTDTVVVGGLVHTEPRCSILSFWQILSTFCNPTDLIDPRSRDIAREHLVDVLNQYTTHHDQGITHYRLPRQQSPVPCLCGSRKFKAVTKRSRKESQPRYVNTLTDSAALGKSFTRITPIQVELNNGILFKVFRGGAYPNRFPLRASADISNSGPDSGYTWSETDTPEISARDHRPDISEFERWYYNFGPYPPRSTDSDVNRKMPVDATRTRGEQWFPWLQSSVCIQEDCKVDLAFLMDGSWSIGKRRFKIQKDFLAEVAQTINVGENGPMMGIIQYGDDPVTEISLKSYFNSRELRTAVDKIVQKGGLSNVGKALSYVNKLYFSDANGNRGGASNVAVVLVDGWPTDKVEEASRLARESGINIFFVTIEGPDENEKQNLVEANFVDKAVCRTNGFYSLPVTSWFALRKAVQPLVKRVCDTDRLMCSKTCLNANDIAFVIDGSSSVGTGNFRTVLQFVANVTREFEISDTDTRVGAVQYTYEQRLEFAFGQYNNKAELLNAIKRVNYWSGGTSTGAAITYAAEQLFSKSKPNKRKIMIVITDGRSYDDVRAPALAVHRQGVIAYSIGIAWAAQDELEYIATDPDKEHSFFVDEFDNLYKFVPKIINNICQEFNSQPRN